MRSKIFQEVLDDCNKQPLPIKSKAMKGTLIKTEQGWIVEFRIKVEGEVVGVDKFPLHPYNVRVIEDCFTSQFSTGVEFKIVDFGSNSYARLINLDTIKELKIPNDIEEHISFLKKCNVDDKDINNWDKGYKKAAETLYTEEQVREAMYKARGMQYVTYSDDEIIESLKKVTN